MGVFTTKKINTKQEFGGVLKAARRRLNIDLETAEAETKIPLKYLTALEENNFSQLPAEAYNIGYVRCYTEFLHLNPDKAVKLYREQRSLNWQAPSHDVTLAPKKVNDWHFLITPRLVGFAMMIIVFGAVAGYIANELKRFTSPPELLVSNIESEFTTENDQVVIEGKTSVGATVSINAEPILVKSDGSFSESVQLSPGLNEISIAAKNRAEKTTRKVVKALYNQNLAKAATNSTCQTQPSC